MVRGGGGARLLDTYEIERKPVALRNAASSTSNFKVLTSPRNCAPILDKTPQGEAARRAIGEQFADAMQASYWEPSGIQMGYSYAGSPIVIGDGTPAPVEQPRYVQSTRPGGRAPHAWLGGGRSMLDGFGRGFVLVHFARASDSEAELLEIVAKGCGMPLQHCPVSRANESISSLYEQPLVLVRPDGHVAWRGERVADAKQLIDTVRGALIAS
jgi:hypothetical protein